MFWQWLYESVRGRVNEATKKACAMERDPARRHSLERGVRQTLRAIADSEFLGADETAAMLDRLTAAMSASATRRAPRPALSWVGAAAALLFMLMPLVSPWMTSRVARYSSPATPVVRLASTGISALSRQATPAPATALAAQPTVWPAMDLALAQAQLTAQAKSTLVVGRAN